MGVTMRYQVSLREAIKGRNATGPVAPGEVLVMRKDDLIPKRLEYRDNPLKLEHLQSEPFDLFATWLEEAVAAGVREPNAFCLCTVDSSGFPDGRMVLLKGVEANSVVFYTNYESRKGKQLRESPRASAVFWWGELERQVRFQGTIDKVSAELSDSYFETRPRDAKLGAWASLQSRPIPNREIFDERLAELEAAYPGVVPRPPHWGGYRLTPHRVEFWQGRRDRLHDRFCYRREETGWSIERLMP